MRNFCDFRLELSVCLQYKCRLSGVLLHAETDTMDTYLHVSWLVTRSPEP